MALYCITPNFRENLPSAFVAGPGFKPYRAQLNVQVLAEIHFDNYDFDLALAVYHEQTHLFGPNAKILFNIGQIHLLFGELRESASWFRKATEIDPFLAIAFFQLGAIYVRMGNFQDARDSYYACRLCVVRGEPTVDSEGVEIEETVEYDQVGLRYILMQGDIERCQRVCETQLKMHHTWPLKSTQSSVIAQEGAITTTPAGTLFRVPDRKARARLADPAKTAEWRFRDEARVLAEV